MYPAPNKVLHATLTRNLIEICVLGYILLY
jgi:hypothetical protein